MFNLVSKWQETCGLFLRGIKTCSVLYLCGCVLTFPFCDVQVTDKEVCLVSGSPGALAEKRKAQDEPDLNKELKKVTTPLSSINFRVNLWQLSRKWLRRNRETSHRPLTLGCLGRARRHPTVTISI